MLKRLFARPSARRPVALNFLTEDGPHITLRDLTHHLALIGPPAETLRLQQHLAIQVLTRQLPVTTLSTPEDSDWPALPPPALTLTASPERSTDQLIQLLRDLLEQHTASSHVPTNLLLYSPHLPLRLARDLTELMRLWRSCALYAFTPEQLLSNGMAPYRFKLDTLFASALILPSALSAYQRVSGVPLDAVPVGHAALIIRDGPPQHFPVPSRSYP